MISFRFHLVSLVAVFLALALGIGMGVTVVDRVGVDRLQGRLDQVRAEVGAANERSDRLQQQLEQSGDYANQSAPYILQSRLTDVSVTAVAVRGIDNGAVDQLEQAVVAAGGTYQGTLWFTSSSSLTDPGVVRQLQQALAVPSGDVAQLRSAFVSRIGAAMTGAAPSASLAPLVSAGVVEWDGATGFGRLEEVPLGAGRLAVLSGRQASVASDSLAIPLVKLLAAQPAKRLVAAEVSNPTETEGNDESAFVKPLRDDSALEGELSTVDHLERTAGRVAAVVALGQLPERTGDYGFGNGASSLLPELNP